MAQFSLPDTSFLSDPATGSTVLQRGIEKESLRITPQGHLSDAPHPAALGSPLAHPSITTDFSEAQLELITAVHQTPEAALQQLRDVHKFVYQGIGDELLWPGSMPCLVGNDEEIPVGSYGTSHIGMAKTIYRRGLGVRYGRLMQTISGIHYNFSVPPAMWQALGVDSQEQITDRYFGLIRNFRRWSWLLLYLFGASPTVCKSFTRSLDHQLDSFDEGSHYLPLATSLRMGPLGYQSSAQKSLGISYNCLDEYADTMHQALVTPYPPYESIGTQRDGEYIQLNTSIIQIENEFYGAIRPKRPVRSGERPLQALRSRGVEYVEVRCLDLNPMLDVGIDEAQVRFLDTFLLVCLLTESPPDTPAEIEALQANQLAIVERGRDPQLELTATGHGPDAPVNARHWARELLNACAQVAVHLDAAHDNSLHTTATQAQLAKVDDDALTPSATILRHMGEQEIPFFRFSMNLAQEHGEHFRSNKLSDTQESAFQESVTESFAQQKAIEDASTESFEVFLKNYLAL